MKKYAFIGDVHSQLDPLKRAIDYCKERSLVPILLGDLFDSRRDDRDSVGVYHLVKEVQERMGGIVLRSNHQFKLERYVRGNKVFIAEDFARTLLDFKEANIDIKDVANWLNTFPYGFVFKDSRGQEYRCAHAMFPDWVMVLDYKESHVIMEVAPKTKNYMLFGPKIKGASWPEQEDRLFWWKEDDKDRDWIRVAGHYHTVFISDKSIVIDGGMGGSCRPGDNSPEILCLWDVEAREMISFPLTA